jgi:molybdenum cofactor guanylyltransferase
VEGTLGVLVAGGSGSRLGLGIAKAMASVGGMTLLERGVATLCGVCDQIVVSAPASLDLKMPAHAGAPVLRVSDPAGATGPLAGVVAGLSAADYRQAIVLAVDLPLATSGALAALLDRLEDHQAVIPWAGGLPQPLGAAYAPTAVAVLAARLEAGERALTVAVESLRALRVLGEDAAGLPGGLDNFFNVNTRADLAEAERRLAVREAAR